MCGLQAKTQSLSPKPTLPISGELQGPLAYRNTTLALRRQPCFLRVHNGALLSAVPTFSHNIRRVPGRAGGRHWHAMCRREWCVAPGTSIAVEGLSQYRPGTRGLRLASDRSVGPPRLAASLHLQGGLAGTQASGPDWSSRLLASRASQDECAVCPLRIRSSWSSDNNFVTLGDEPHLAILGAQRKQRAGAQQYAVVHVIRCSSLTTRIGESSTSASRQGGRLCHAIESVYSCRRCLDSLFPMRSTPTSSTVAAEPYRLPADHISD
ncbi:hypothetical protein PYCCODRAFT_1048600 [Trametes coccinea BRFM310]|uniref:Uncharacterized protein n=1 Tax=Trametes coccinea (strain BRFM310) TaxID=1353009 RepID=A0A1Y2IA10_TRAC3|nr:hypothetical protein PYCCODRAFT_1048600 [Trametes coccinea BRFM310]